MILAIIKVLQGLLDLFPSLEFNFPTVEPVSQVLNYFAWARAFLPVDMIVFLLGLTVAYYTFRLTFALVKYIVNLILSAI